jgi:hypothetical protein
VGRPWRAPERDRARPVPTPGPFPTPGAWSRLVPRPDLAHTSRRAIRSAGRASTVSSPTSPPSCSPTVPPASTARWSRSMAASG